MFYLCIALEYIYPASTHLTNLELKKRGEKKKNLITTTTDALGENCGVEERENPGVAGFVKSGAEKEIH